MFDQALCLVSLVESGFAECRMLEHRRIPALVAPPGFARIGQFEIAAGTGQHANTVGKRTIPGVIENDHASTPSLKTVLSPISVIQIKPLA